MITLDNALFTEMHLIGAHDLIRRTVDGLDEDALAAVRARAPYPDWAVELLPRTLGTRRPATPADPDALAEAIGEAMTIERVQGATLVTVTLRHGSAETADFLLARHIETYLARRNALFSPDSDRFFDEELAARRAEQARVLGEIAALHATYGISDLEDQRTLYRDRLASFEAGLRESPADPALLEASADARDGLARLASFENGLRPLEAELMRIAESVETLASEREAWSLTRAYRDEVAPTVDVVDVRPAALERVGLAPTASVATAGVFGMLLAWVMAIAVLFVRRLRAAPAGEAGSDTAQAGATTLSEASGREGTSSA
jgi:hypothetical protein